MIKRPEILSPAGDMESLNSALNFGADAVFLAGKMFGMRSAAQNFDNEQLKQACMLAHSKGAKIYVTCNTLPRNNELDKLPEFLMYAQDCGVDAFIIADLGVFEMAKKYAPKVERHISTQAGITNYATANVLYNMGASRVVLAREIPLDEIGRTIR
jgi:putative protease